MLCRGCWRQRHAGQALINFVRFYSPPRSSKPSREDLDPFAELHQAVPEEPNASEELDVDRLDWSHLEQPERKYTSEQFLATSQPRNDQREEMIFKEVLGNVLSSPSRARPRATEKPSLSSSILALFEPSGASQSPSAQQQSPTMASLLDGISKPSKSVAATNAEFLKKRERASEVLRDVFAHIEQLGTNREVMKYFEDVVMPRFSEANRISETDQPLSTEDPRVGPETVSWILEKCIWTLSTEFSDPVGALHLFEISKHHSIEFFAEACSADVYNQVIRIKWHDYRDLYAVVNLAAEIAINAIPPNLETTEILSKVYRDASDSTSGNSTSALGLPLWTGQDEKRLEELNRYRARFQSAWASRPVLRF